MLSMGLAAMVPGPNTSRAHLQHKAYPSLLRAVAVLRSNQVLSTDITYIRLDRGFAYLVVIIDWYSRRVLSWRISNSLGAAFCVDCLEDALRLHSKPQVFNIDQWVQFKTRPAAYTTKYSLNLHQVCLGLGVHFRLPNKSVWTYDLLLENIIFRMKDTRVFQINRDLIEFIDLALRHNHALAQPTITIIR